MHICSSPIKQTTPLNVHSPRSWHLPHALRQVGDGFRRTNILRVQKSYHRTRINQRE
jgi:hypothetical protein